jgi:hypothetical protein
VAHDPTSSIRPIDTFNKFFVCSGRDDGVGFLKPVPSMLTRDDALLLAAYLVAMADPCQDQWPAVLEAVHNT